MSCSQYSSPDKGKYCRTAHCCGLTREQMTIGVHLHLGLNVSRFGAGGRVYNLAPTPGQVFPNRGTLDALRGRRLRKGMFWINTGHPLPVVSAYFAKSGRGLLEKVNGCWGRQDTDTIPRGPVPETDAECLENACQEWEGEPWSQVQSGTL